MDYPFPGMDPYLEHPTLWEGLHARLIVAIANQLQPQIDPRYVASVEERVYIEGPQRRVPDVWIQKVDERGETSPLAEPQHVPEADTALIVEVDNLEIHEARVEILDAYNGMKLVALVEVVSPANKAAGPGRASYKAKQEQTLARDCHLIEIDLIRRGRHVVCIPQWRLQELKINPFEYLCCVSRWPTRNRFELYPRKLHQRLPRLKVPLAEGDPDATLDLQAALEQVYADGRYYRRIRYNQRCKPRWRPRIKLGPTSRWRPTARSIPISSRGRGSDGRIEIHEPNLSLRPSPRTCFILRPPASARKLEIEPGHCTRGLQRVRGSLAPEPSPELSSHSRKHAVPIG